MFFKLQIFVWANVSFFFSSVLLVFEALVPVIKNESFSHKQFISNTFFVFVFKYRVFSDNTSLGQKPVRFPNVFWLIVSMAHNTSLVHITSSAHNASLAHWCWMYILYIKFLLILIIIIYKMFVYVSLKRNGYLISKTRVLNEYWFESMTKKCNC